MEVMDLFDQAALSAPDLAEVESRLSEWASEVRGNRKALLDVPLHYTDKTTICRRYLSGVTGIDEEHLRITLRDNRHVLADLEREMQDEGIIVQGFNILDSEQSRLLLRWYEHLTDDEKLNVELRGDLVTHIGYLDQMEAFKKSPGRYDLYRIKRAEIAQDVLRRRELVAAIERQETEQRLEQWALKALSSRKALLDVELGIKDPVAIAPSYLLKEIGEGADRLQSKDWLLKVIEGMRQEKIILPGRSALECEARRMLLRWYENLSDEQKLDVEVFGGKVKMKGYLDQIPELVPGHKLLPLYNDTRAEIASDVVRRLEERPPILEPSKPVLDPAIEQRLQQWSTEVVQHRDVLLGVQLTRSGQAPSVSQAYLSEQLGIQLNERIEHQALQDVIQEMTAQKIIVPGYGSNECDLRRIVLRWYEALEDHEKTEISLARHAVSHEWLMERLDGIKLTDTSFKLYNVTRKEIGKEVLSLQEKLDPSESIFPPQVRKQLVQWIQSVLGSREKLLEVELAQKGRLAVSVTYLSNLTGISRESCSSFNAMPQIIQAMSDEGIIVEGYKTLDCDKRRRLLRWYEGLSDEQKLGVVLYGESVKHVDYLDQLLEFTEGHLTELYNLTRAEIGKDVLRRRAEVPEVVAPSLRVKKEEVDRRLDAWREDVLTSREKLLTVQLNASGPLGVSIPYLSELLGASRSAIANRDGMQDVIEAMQRERIILPGYMSSECEKRRKLLRWYEGLSEQEKQSIPMFGNKVKKKGYLDQIPELQGLFTTSMFKLINLTLDEINEDLLRLGVGDSDYQTVQERELEKALSPSPQEDKVSAAKRIKELRAVPIASVADLSTSSDIPFSPLLHLFAAASMESHSHSGQSNYYEAWKAFTRCLAKEGYAGDESVLTMLGEHSLTRFRKYLATQLQDEQMSTSVATTHMSAARKMLERARAVKGLELEEFYPAPGFEVLRETDLYSPYSPGERTRISEAIQAAIARTHALLQPYVLSGVGEDPYDERGIAKRGLVPIDAARWIFENKLDCVPINYSDYDTNNKYHKYFRNAVNVSPLSIYEVYESWGYLYDRSARVLAPYIARLAQVTGLNADSIATLEIDDFVTKHPLSQRPCLRYWKERSTGEKEYHLDIFKADISWLTTSQGKEVKKIFDDVLYITSEFRADADPSIRNHLFIYKSASTRTFGEIKTMAAAGRPLNIALKAFAVANNLLTDDGEPLSLSPSRFRPSFVSELIEQGVSPRELQVILGHETLEVTLKYLDRMDFNRVAREKIDKALREIHAETISDQSLIPVVNVDVSNQEDIIFKTPLGGCSNIFNPPDFIKNSRSYVPGRPCSLYNKCLACENNIITKSNLPELFAMRRDYIYILQSNRVADTPYGSVVLENLALLESILTPETSDFSKEELEEAERLSEYVDTNIAIEGVGL